MEIGSEEWCAATSLVLADVELPEVQATVEQRIDNGNGGPVLRLTLCRCWRLGNTHGAPLTRKEMLVTARLFR